MGKPAWILGEESGEVFWSLPRTLEEKLGPFSRVPKSRHRGLPFQTLVDWCSRTPCQNGGHCARTGASFYCLCPSGWSGRLCDIQSLPCREAAAQIGEGVRVTGFGGLGRVCMHILPASVSRMRVRQST